MGSAERVHVEARGLGATRRFAVAPGTVLLEGMLDAGLPAPHRCREARCGRCRVTVASGGEALYPADAAECARLGGALSQGQRLMCRARARAGGNLPLVLEY